MKIEMTGDSCEEATTKQCSDGIGDATNMDVGSGAVINDESVCSTSNNEVDLTMSSDVPRVFPRDVSNTDWLRIAGIRLTQQNKSGILRGDKLNGLIINFIHKLLKKQFPIMKGLQSTLLQCKTPKPSENTSAPQVQVIPCRNDHWVVASTVHSGSTAKCKFTIPFMTL